MGGYGEGRLLPGHLSRLIEQAGSSASRWHEQELAEWVDPSKSLRRTAKAVNYLFALALAVALTGLLVTRWEPLPFVAGLLVVLGYLVRKRLSVHPASSVLAVAAALPPVIPVLSVVVLVALAVLSWALLRPGRRDWALGLAALAVILLDPLAALASEAYPVIMPAAAVSTVLVVGYLVGPKPLPRPWARLSGDDLEAYPASPPSSLPFLVSVLRRGQVQHPPREISRKKAGAYGERKTAVVLLGLQRRHGTRIAHDVVIPGADNANADHVALTRSGVYVIDSKQFGSLRDPGLVTYDTSTGHVVHRNSKGSRSIEGSLKTAAWAVAGVSALLKTPGRAVLAIHGAAVARDLTVERNGVVIEVIPAWALVPRIDGAERILSARELAGGRVGMYRLKSATTGTTPDVTWPRGLTRSGKRAVAAKVTEFYGEQAPEQGPEPRAHRWSRDKDPAPPWDRCAAVGQQEPAAEEPLGAPQRLAHEPTLPTPFAPSPSSETAPSQGGAATSSRAAAAPALVLSARERVEDRWEQMKHSEPAAFDEVDPELRSLQRGSPALLIDLSETNVTTYKIVTMTGVCRGVTGTYIWYCAPEQYRIHLDTGHPVHVATIATEKVMPHIPDGPGGSGAGQSAPGDGSP